MCSFSFLLIDDLLRVPRTHIRFPVSSSVLTISPPVKCHCSISTCWKQTQLVPPLGSIPRLPGRISFFSVLLEYLNNSLFITGLCDLCIQSSLLISWRRAESLIQCLVWSKRGVCWIELNVDCIKSLTDFSIIEQLNKPEELLMSSTNNYLK